MVVAGVCDHVKVSWWQLFLGLILFLFDQSTKAWVSLSLPIVDPFAYVYPYGGIGIFHHVGGLEFSINHMTNKGAAWGMLDHYQYPLLLVRIALVVGLCVYLGYFNRHASWRLPLVMIIAGAAGNVLDFFTYGHVVDMFHVVIRGYDFPVFNIADSAISLGVGTLFFLSWFEKTS